MWYRNGQLHRTDGQAIEDAVGDHSGWYLNDKKLTEREFKAKTKPQLVRTAVEDGLIRTVGEDGTVMYQLDGKLHREDGPAVIYLNGSKHWWLNGKQHRIGGPAVFNADGYKAWIVNGDPHRAIGPAVIYASGKKE